VSDFKRELKIRIYDRELNDKLEQYCRSNNMPSINECIQSIIAVFINGVDTNNEIVKINGGKLITYFGRPIKCSRCSRDIKIFDKAYWIVYEFRDNRKQTVYLCYDCYVETSDQTIANLIKKREKLKLEVKVLQKEHEKYITALQQLEQLESLTKLYLQFREVMENAYKTRIYSNEDLKKLYNELIIKLEDICKQLEENAKISKIIWSKLKKILGIETRKYTSREEQYTTQRATA
jgi:uncharacterized protein Smg (DUF494 family)